MISIFYAADIHGSEKCFLKFINAGKFYKVDALILGGDITAKFIIPVVKKNEGIYEVEFVGQRHICATEEEVISLEKKMHASGFYTYRLNEKEKKKISSSKSEQEKLFDKLIIETLKKWITIAEDRLRGTGIECFIMPGNDDNPKTSEIINNSNYVVNPDLKVVTIKREYQMISIGFSNKTPFDSPRELEEEEMFQLILKLWKQTDKSDKVIFNLHCPPYDTGLDLGPEIDKDLKIVTRGGQPNMIPVGSKAVRKAIEEYQPLLSLHGHVHESRGVIKIGKTLCLNPGSEYGEGILRGVIINLSDNKIENYQFISG